MVMIIPETITVGGYVFEIQLLPGDCLGGNFGKIDWSDMTIKLNKDASESVQAETLLHEVLHSVEGVVDFKLDHNVLSALSNCLFGVLRNNNLDFSRPDPTPALTVSPSEDAHA